MDKIKKNSQFGPQIAEPTDDEINETIEELKAKYEIFTPREDAAKYWKLKKELGWWMSVEMNSEDPEAITENMAKDVRDTIRKNKGENITLDEAYRQAKKALSYTIPLEKDRVAKEMRKIIKRYQ